MPRLTSLSRSVSGLVALVTGAASGMGRATAFLLADEGAKVAVTDVADPAPVVDAITKAGGEAIGRVLDVSDLTGEARMIRSCLPYLQASACGRVVNIASTEGLGASPRHSPYTAAKHGVIGLTRSLAVELGRTGVTVNCVCPGPIRTGMTAGIPDSAKDTFARRRVPMRRYGIPRRSRTWSCRSACPRPRTATGLSWWSTAE